MTTHTLSPAAARSRRGFAKVIAAVAAVAVLALAGCGSDDNTVGATSIGNTTCATGTLSGAGATFSENIVKEWIKNYTASCKDTTINDQGVGSGTGIKQFTEGTIDFAGSDVPLKPEELAAAEAKHGKVVQIPWTAGPIAVEYTLNGVNKLQLSGKTVAGIFAGTIKKWNEKAVADDNPGVKLPDTAIQVVHRSDGSGTTAALTAYLTAVAPEVWKAGSAKEVQWPVGQGAKGSDQVTQAVKTTNGAIGYAELSYPKTAGVAMAHIRNESGAYVAADSANGVTAALADVTVPGNLNITVNYKPTAPTAYPISTVSYVILAGKPADANKAKLAKSFINYALNDGQKLATGLDYSPLPIGVLTPSRVITDTIGLG